MVLNNLQSITNKMQRFTALARTRTPGTLLKHKPIQTIWYAATPPRLAYMQPWLINSVFGKDIVTPWWWS